MDYFFKFCGYFDGGSWGKILVSYEILRLSFFFNSFKLLLRVFIV